MEAITGNTRTKPYDHYIIHDGVECAGRHIIYDVYDAENLTDTLHIKHTLQKCIIESGATLLHIHLHHFGQNQGVSGVAILAESHISIHTWPERNFAAIDVFMCGSTNPDVCLDIFKERFNTDKIKVNSLLRGD